MKPLGVMQLIDTLAAGGAEGVAVNIANALPRDRFRAFLCATRRGGPLADALAPDVGLLELQRRGRVDWRALRRLAGYIDQHGVDLLHAHSTSLLTAALVRVLRPRLRIVWHYHYGAGLAARSVWRYRLLRRAAHAAITVTEPLAEWARTRLAFPSERVFYLPNFAPWPASVEAARLPGEVGKRLVCVANIRPPKDHLTLVRAMRTVVDREPGARLFLAGALSDEATAARIRDEIAALGLGERVSVLGARRDVPNLLAACDIGVLSSSSEGLPLALVEYGMAGLAAVSTRVGQCAAVLEDGRSGLLTPPGDPAALAEALLSLLAAPERRRALGERLHRRITAEYSETAFLARLDAVYRTALGTDGRPSPSS